MVKDEDGNNWLTPKEAATRLGLTTGYIYHLKNYLTHRKSTRLFFLESTLVDDYMSIK